MVSISLMAKISELVTYLRSLISLPNKNALFSAYKSRFIKYCNLPKPYYKCKLFCILVSIRRGAFLKWGLPTKAVIRHFFEVRQNLLACHRWSRSFFVSRHDRWECICLRTCRKVLSNGTHLFGLSTGICKRSSCWCTKHPKTLVTWNCFNAL